MPSTPAYSRLQVDERREQLLQTGVALFAERPYEAISMREIAESAGVSKALLYHYFPSKTDLFKAAVEEAAAGLRDLIEPDPSKPLLEQLAGSLDAYLAWIDENAGTWKNLMRSAATVPEAGDLIESFRRSTLDRAITGLTGNTTPPPVLRSALVGWLGYVDAAILDWLDQRDLTRDQLRELLASSFGAALLTAQRLEPTIRLDAS